MVTFTIDIPQMLAYIPYMDPMGVMLPQSNHHAPASNKVTLEIIPWDDKGEVTKSGWIATVPWCVKNTPVTNRALLLLIKYYIGCAFTYYIYWSENSCKFYPTSDLVRVLQCSDPCFWKSQTYHEQEMLYKFRDNRVPIHILGVNKYWMNFEPQHGLIKII